MAALGAPPGAGFGGVFVGAVAAWSTERAIALARSLNGSEGDGAPTDGAPAASVSGLGDGGKAAARAANAVAATANA